MRLLFDEQLAEDLCQLLHEGFPESLHIRLLGRGGASDEEIQAARPRAPLPASDKGRRLSSAQRAARCAAQGHLAFAWETVQRSEIAALVTPVHHRADIQRFVDQEEATFLELGSAR